MMKGRSGVSVLGDTRSLRYVSQRLRGRDHGHLQDKAQSTSHPWVTPNEENAVGRTVQADDQENELPEEATIFLFGLGMGSRAGLTTPFEGPALVGAAESRGESWRRC